MPNTKVVRSPAGFVPTQVVAFGAEGDLATAVDGASPLPVRATTLPAAAAPLGGSLAASGTVGPFLPDLGRAIWLTLTGTWSGTVQVMRSTDGGATLLPLTAGGQPWASFTANANEAVGEEVVAGASYWLTATVASGTLGYRVQQ